MPKPYGGIVTKKPTVKTHRRNALPRMKKRRSSSGIGKPRKIFNANKTTRRRMAIGKRPR